MSTYRGLMPIEHSVFNSVLNVKALVGAFNQEKDLEGAFSMIMNLREDLRLQLYVVTACPCLCSVSLCPGLDAVICCGDPGWWPLWPAG